MRSLRQDEQEARLGYSAVFACGDAGRLGAHVRDRRCQLALSQEQLASRPGTCRVFVSQLERGDHVPSLTVLHRILGALGEELLVGTPLSGLPRLTP